VPSGQPLRAEERLSVQEIKDRLAELNAAAAGEQVREAAPSPVSSPASNRGPARDR